MFKAHMRTVKPIHLEPYAIFHSGGRLLTQSEVVIHSQEKRDVDGSTRFFDEVVATRRVIMD